MHCGVVYIKKMPRTPIQQTILNKIAFASHLKMVNEWIFV